MAPMHLLLVEDDPQFPIALREALAARGYSIELAATAGEAAACVAVHDYALILLDLGLPDLDGIDLIRALRAANNATPILALTGRGEIADRVAGLRAGADDYVVKPIAIDELVARIQAVARRHARTGDQLFRLANIAFAPEAGDLWVDGACVDLSPRERDIVRLFLRRPDRVVAKSMLAELLADLGEAVSANAMEVYVYRLRKKLDDAGAKVRIETVRGIGYLLRAC